MLAAVAAGVGIMMGGGNTLLTAESMSVNVISGTQSDRNVIDLNGIFTPEELEIEKT